MFTDKRKGLLFLHSAILIFGGTGLFAKLIPLPAADITLWRSMIAALALLLILLIRKRPLVLQSTQHTFAMLGCGLLMGVHWVTYFQAMQIAGVAVGMLALYTYPIMMVFLEPLFHGQRPQGLDILCAALMLLGVGFLVPDFNLANDITLGVCWGIFSALLFALRNVLQRHILRGYSGDTTMFYQGLMAALVSIPLASYPESTTQSNTLFQLLILGALFTAIPHAFFANSLRYLAAKTVGLIACLQPVYGALFAYWVLAEQPTWTVFVGGALIVGTAALETYRT